MFWHYLRTDARRRIAFFGLLLGVAMSLGGGGVAQAGTDSFCNQWVGQYGICQGPTHTLTASRGWNQTGGAGCGGARDTSYYCANPAGCHSYAGISLRTPAARHRSSASRYLVGYSTWGSTPAPAWCDPGTTYAVAGPISTAAADLAGVPALERKKEQAPARVAALWPTADAATARRFSTPKGDGWVLVLPAEKKVCTAVPDADGYGYGCQSFSDARTLGSLSTLEDEDAERGTGDVAFGIVAEGSKGLKVTRRDGSSRTVAPQDGVIVVELGADDVAVSLDAADASAVKAQRWSVGRR